ncbi:MAG: DUF3592 domain-containing protein [Algicola sp.]|nr:DUF3592 domain-containing protein [Algicola sp.]
MKLITTKTQKKQTLLRIAATIAIIFVVIIAIRFDDIQGGFLIASNQYETSEGHIVVSQGKLRYKIQYQFEVNGQQYTSNKVHFGPTKYNSLKKSQDLSNAYPVGQQVVVYYKKDNPGFSVLNPSVNSNDDFILMFALLGFIGLVLLIAAISVKSESDKVPVKQPNKKKGKRRKNNKH